MANSPKKAPAAKPAASAPAATAEPIQKLTEAAAIESQSAIETIAKQATGAQEQVRKVTQEAIATGKASYERVKSASEEANQTLEVSFQSASKGFTAFNAKAFDIMRANSEAMFDFVKALSGAKTMAEVVSLQTDLTRKQYEAMTAQNKELAALVQKAANDAMEPIKTGMSKVMQTAR